MRYVGIINAAIWFGGGLIFTLVVLPGVFSADVYKLFAVSPESPFYKFYPGGVAEILFGRYFIVQYVCGLVALGHLFAEKLYLGRAIPRIAAAIVVAALVISFIGGAWVQPKLRGLRQTMYSQKAGAEEKAVATRSFGMWHGVSQVANLFMLVGLLAHLINVSRPEEPGRYGTLFPKFRG